MWEAWLNRDATDAELQAWTDTDKLDRYRPPADLVAALNATAGSELTDIYTDYDVAAATSTASIGGRVWTRNGTPAKTTLVPEIEHFINLPDWHCNVQDVPMLAQDGLTTYRRGNAYREFHFTSDTPRFSVRYIADWTTGILTTLGIRQDNTPLTPLTPDFFSKWRRQDVLGLSGSHTYRVIDGMQSIQGGVVSTKYNGTGVRAVTSVLVQAPKTATFTVVAPPTLVGANVLVVTGDSFQGQNSTTTPTTEASLMQIRDVYPGPVIAFSFGSGGHWHAAADTTTINAFVADLSTCFAGAASKRWLDDWSANDHNLFSSFWSSRANMRTQMGTLFDAANAAIPALTIHLRTGLLRTAAFEGSTVSDISGPGTGAGTQVGGAIFQDIRDDYNTVQSTRSGFITAYDGKAVFPNFAPSSNHNSGDNFHPSPAGQTTIATADTAHLHASADSIGGLF